MKITDLRIRELQGTMEHPEPFWEERLVRPVDIYPAFRARGGNYSSSLGDGRYKMSAAFLEIHTDEGVTGISGPFSHHQGFIIDTQLRSLLIGADPIANELLWDQMYRTAIHGRKGETMMAISVVDCGLWDIRGKWMGQPVYRLLGGPTREEIPTYASALGYSLEPEAVTRRAQEIVAQGYKATKWFFRDGPSDGPAGIARNLRLAETLREAVGEDVDVMLDAWSSWDVPYSIKMAEHLAAYDIHWLEEPVLADKLESYVEIQRNSPILIAGGEHEYTRWGFRYIVENKAMDVLQPDIYWAGGISEVVKICTLAATFDLPVVPHGHSSHATAHVIASQPPNLCPIQEYLIKWNIIHQYFLKNKIEPQNGRIQVSWLDAPGLGLALDEDKIESERELNWRD
ncbi:MAG: mandelate racemase/muconate lactonizing protein [Candidatus Poribacteria bacterium]|nr:mandelate racemase/muconate lactonizing protein [Candidatus Poribacteria bacterium]